jgi:hypothetical protein
MPPHVFNALPERAGDWMLRFTDAVGQRMPVLRHHGGLVLFTGEKTDPEVSRAA